MSSGDDRLVADMPLRALKEALRDFVDGRAEHKVGNIIQPLAADLQRIERDSEDYHHAIHGNGKEGILTRLARGDEIMERLERTVESNHTQTTKALDEIKTEIRASISPKARTQNDGVDWSKVGRNIGIGLLIALGSGTVTLGAREVSGTVDAKTIADQVQREIERRDRERERHPERDRRAQRMNEPEPED